MHEDGLKPAESVVGRILFERFLVLADVSDRVSAARIANYLVKDLRNSCRHVILRSFHGLAIDGVQSRPTLREVCETLIRVKHSNIEEIVEAGHLYDGSPYCLAGVIQGLPLSYLLADGKRFELSDISRFVEALSDGVSAAHEHRIMHCDIRPSNLFVRDPEGIYSGLRLVNFGTAWPVDARGENLSNLMPNSEPALYAAPELFETLAPRSPAADIYSVAAVVYRLATGVPPYMGMQRRAIDGGMSADVLTEAAAGRTDLSKKTLDLLVAALQCEPAWRPQEMDDFGARLASSLRPRISSLPRENKIDDHRAELPTEPLENEVKLQPDAQLEIANEPLIKFRSQSVERHKAAVSDRSVAWALIIFLLAGALSIPIGQSMMSGTSEMPAAAAMESRPAEDRRPLSLTYWVESGRPAAQDHLNEDGRRALAEGVGQLVLETENSGKAYIIKEITDDSGRVGYQMIFPADTSRGGSPAISPGQKVRVGPNALDKVRSSKGIWIVWVANEGDDLEPFRTGSHDGLIAGDENARRLRHFLERNRNQRLVVNDDEASGRTELNGVGQRIVHRIDLSDL
ncbi:MAG TPA: protein kinase [Pyrinomonadaceae bacterium]|nr:protein kinase [Pyrinomonadaceae bacterium]